MQTNTSGITRTTRPSTTINIRFISI